LQLNTNGEFSSSRASNDTIQQRGSNASASTAVESPVKLLLQKDAEIAAKDAEIAQLRARLAAAGL
jgi:hypothetical protein